MKNNLFLICPTSQSESMMRREFGEGSYFLTALGTAFKFHEIKHIEAVADIIRNENIREIHVVQDSCCHFIDRVLEREKSHGTYAEAVLVDLLIDNYAYVMQPASSMEKRKRLAKLNVKRQAESLLSSQLLQQFLYSYDLEVRGMITNRVEKTMEEVNLNLNAYS